MCGSLGPLGHPGGIAPPVAGGEDDRGGGRRDLGGLRHRVGLEPTHTVAADDLVLVPGARSDLGDEHLPHAAGTQRTHRGGGAVPVVEVTDHPHALCVGCPDRESHAVHGTVRGLVDVRVGAEHLPQLFVPALGDEVLVHLAQGGQEAVRVVRGQFVAAVRHGQPVVRNRGHRQLGHPDPRVLVLHGEAILPDDHVHLGRVRAQHPHRDAVGVDVGAEHLVRLAVGAVDQGGQCSGVYLDHSDHSRSDGHDVGA